jgi:hypothetical protein
LLLPIGVFAQNQTAIRYSQFITAADIKQNITVLASDSLEGRETGQPGQKKAANYIAKQFESFGIPKIDSSGYFQRYFLYKNTPNKVSVSVDGKELSFLEDYIHFSDFDNDTIESNEVLFLKNNISNVDNKVVFVKIKNCTDEQVQKLMNSKAKAIFFITDNIDYTTYLKLVFLHYKHERENTISAEMLKHKTPCFNINKKCFNKMFSFSQRRFKDQVISKKINIKISINAPYLEGENVLGYVEGSDLKEELIVVSAHYDHLGFHDGKIYHGADDDASGTSAIIALAKAFAQAKKEGNGPRRSILFLAVSGEEKGLLGSSYYSEHPVFPLQNTVADLNIDMIGRIDTTYKTDPNYIYLIGSDKLSTELHNISDSANTMYTQLKLDYKFNDPKDKNRFYYRSDHYNFAKHNIPVIFYFNGVHEDYHKPTDTVDKINFDKVEKISKLVFFTAWELANRDKRIVVDKENDFKGTR